MAKLSAMRYKDYIWPHNPKVYAITFRRDVSVRKVPFGGEYLEDMGKTHRVMEGEGEFTGSGAYEQFRKLASVFYSGGPGPLIHPLWQSAQVYFVSLKLRQEPKADYVRYSFTFWEAGTEPAQGLTAATTQSAPPDASSGASKSSGVGGEVYYTVRKGDTLWGIAQSRGTTVSTLVKLNPQIKNPNRIYPGERVRVK